MYFPPGREKALPDIPVDSDSHVEPGEVTQLWNEAGLRARSHRKKYHMVPDLYSLSTPTSIPELEDIPSVLPCVDLPIADKTSPATRIRKRWGLRSARPVLEKQETDSPITLKILRAIAKDWSKKKRWCAKSVPNLSDGSAGGGAKLQFAEPRVVEAPPDDTVSSPRTLSPHSELVSPEMIFRPEDMDKNAIYFTVDASRGSVQFQFITQIPDHPISLWRPNSPLLHRYQLSSDKGLTTMHVL